MKRRRAMDLNGRSVIIAGGTGTIGRAIAEHAIRLGFTAIALARGERRKPPAGAHFVACDIGSPDDLHRVLTLIQSEYPAIWAGVNCVGSNRIRAFEQYSVDDIDCLLQDNLKSAILFCQRLIPILRSKGGGRLINIASQAGIAPQEYNVVYSAAKAGVIALGKGLARELARDSISVITVCPGDIESPMMGAALNEFGKLMGSSAQAAKERLLDAVPCGRMGTATEVAEVVGDLLCARSHFFTGSTVLVAGGRTCH